MGFLLVAILAVAAVLLQAREASDTGLEDGAAGQLAVAELERCKALPWNLLDSYATAPAAAYTRALQGQPCGLTLEVQRRSGADDGMLGLRLTLRWQQRRTQGGDDHGFVRMAAAERTLSVRADVCPEARW